MKAGEIFERKVHQVVRECLRSGYFGLLPSQVRVYRGKKYLSRDRDGYIATDVSLEIFMQGADEPYILWIWECKDYSSSIDVGRIEEFHSKLEQLGSDRTKGTLASTSNFERSAVNYAKSKGIGLVRILPNDQILSVANSPTNSLPDGASRTVAIWEALTEPRYVGINDPFVAVLHNGWGMLYPRVSMDLLDVQHSYSPNLVIHVFLWAQLRTWGLGNDVWHNETALRKARSALIRSIKGWKLRRSLKLFRILWVKKTSPRVARTLWIRDLYSAHNTLPAPADEHR